MGASRFQALALVLCHLSKLCPGCRYAQLSCISRLHVSSAYHKLFCVCRSLNVWHSCQCLCCADKGASQAALLPSWPFGAKLALWCKSSCGEESSKQHMPSTKTTLLPTLSGGKLPRYTSLAAPLSWVSADWQQACLSSAPSLLHTYSKAVLLQALAEKEAVIVRQKAALVGQEGALVRQEEQGLKTALRLMVQSPILEALKEDSKAMRQVISHSLNSSGLIKQYTLTVSPQTA